MRHALKLVILSGIAVFFGVFLSVAFNVTNGGTITITPSDLLNPHRVRLKSLNLSRNLQDTGYYELAVRWLDSFDILTWLVVGSGTTSITGGAAVMVGWWDNNHINLSDSAWIVWWWDNKINNSQDAVIWGGYKNEIAWKKSVVWGWYHNIGNSDGWIILGWDNNYLFSSSIVLWWQWHYASNANNNLLLGKNTNINNIERSFVWGGEDDSCQPSANESATLCAPKWILIWTYNGITGVNLVVNGAVKIGSAELWEWSAWEIKMINWCFYAYNGSRWYVFGKSSKASGICNAVTLGKTCKFGKIELQEWDVVVGYSVPYANDCKSVEKRNVKCLSSWSLSENVYSYCYKMEGVRWDLYEGWWYECVWDVPANATLVAWSDQWLTANTLRKLYGASEAEWRKCAYVCDDWFTKVGNQCRWIISNPLDPDPGEYWWYSCEWPKPTWDGYIFTTKNPQNQHQAKPWTHVTDGATQSSLGPCEYTCNISAGYTWDGTNSNCKKQQHWHFMGGVVDGQCEHYGETHNIVYNCIPDGVCSTENGEFECQLNSGCYGCS